MFTEYYISILYYYVVREQFLNVNVEYSNIAGQGDQLMRRWWYVPYGNSDNKKEEDEIDRARIETEMYIQETLIEGENSGREADKARE